MEATRLDTVGTLPIGNPTGSGIGDEIASGPVPSNNNMTTTPHSPAPSCIRCSYDLSGLDAGGVCPECSLPIERSIVEVRWLRQADPAWLEIVHRGLTRLDRSASLITVIILIGLCFAFGALIVAGVVGDLNAPDWVGAIVSIAPMAAICIAGAWWAVLHARGCWELGTPANPPFGPAPWARVSVRYGGILLPALLAWNLAVSYGEPGWSAIERDINRAVAQVIAFSALWGLFRVMADLERQTGAMSSETARRHRNTRKNLIGLGVIILIATWAGRSRGSTSGWGMSLILIALWLLGQMTGRVREAVGIELALSREGLLTEQARADTRAAAKL